LKHSKTATNNFNQLTKETDIDIAFIQEPYVYQNQVTRISRNYKVFTCGNGRKLAAVVVVNKMIDAILTGQLSEEDIVVVEIIQGNLKLLATSIYLDAENEISRDQGNLKLLATSIYLDAENEITRDLNKIENIIQFAKGRRLLVAMDSNAR
jgi:hypothetical protein